MRDALIEQGAIPVVISALSSVLVGSADFFDPALVGASLTTIARLLESDNGGQVKDKFEDAGGISLLVKFLEMYGPSTVGIVADTLSYAIEGLALMVAGKCGSVMTAVAESGGV